MNKRAKVRVIGVAAIIVIIVIAIVAALNNSGSVSVYTTVEDAVKDSSKVGEQIQVGGTVVAGTYDPTKTPMEFDIVDENDKAQTGEKVHVIYDGQIPSTFGDGVVAIVTGKLDADGTVTASEMITKCPSKYESAEGAMTPVSLRAQGDAAVGKETKLAGGVVDGSIKPVGEDYRFIIQSQGQQMNIIYAGALPEGMEDGTAVIITGKLTPNDTFEATDVAIDEAIKAE